MKLSSYVRIGKHNYNADINPAGGPGAKMLDLVNPCSYSLEYSRYSTRYSHEFVHVACSFLYLCCRNEWA